MSIRRFIFFLASLTAPTTVHAGELTLVADRDQTLFESPTGCCSSGAGDSLFAGDRNGGSVNRALVRFDVAGALPPGATVTRVRLDLRLSRSRAGDEVMTLHRVLGDWGEGTSAAPAAMPGGTAGQGAAATPGDATWLHASFPGVLWATPGGDFDGTPSASLLLGGAAGIGVQSFESSGMVADVQAWFDGSAGNFGWLLKADDEGGSRSARRFDSRETSQPGAAPSLVVEYIGPLGTPYCTAASNSTGTGARISAVGCDAASNASLRLVVDDLPPRVPGLLFYSGTQVQTPLGDGFLCVGGSTVSIHPAARASGAGRIEHQVDFGLPSAVGIVSGASLNFQCWYRDRAALGAGHNLSDGLAILFQ